MALSKIIKINNKLSWALWKIDSGWEAMQREHVFSPGVLHTLNKISHPQKKAEFLASRLALFTLLDTAGIGRYELVKDRFGKPFVKDATVHISLANSFPYAVAILDLDKPTGIDIESPSDKLVRVQHKFLHNRELPLVKDHQDKLCLAWCAKESLYKLYGRKSLSFKQHICIHKIAYPHHGMLSAEISYEDHFSRHRLHIEKERNFFITFCV